MPKIGLSLELINKLFELDPETGILTWKVTLGASRARVGNRAGTIGSGGYRYVKINGVRFREHLIIWLILHGEWCPRRIDHEDRNRGNNRPSNLRKSTESQQRQNAALRLDNATGARGVRQHACGKYDARLSVDGKEKYLGLFATIEQAAEVARVARLKHYGDFAPAYDRR